MFQSQWLDIPYVLGVAAAAVAAAAKAEDVTALAVSCKTLVVVAE